MHVRRVSAVVTEVIRIRSPAIVNPRKGALSTNLMAGLEDRWHNADNVLRYILYACVRSQISVYNPKAVTSMAALLQSLKIYTDIYVNEMYILVQNKM